VRSLDEAARAALRAYAFPGNVRELRNIVEQAVILTKDKVVTRELLSLPAAAAAAWCGSATCCPTAWRRRSPA